MLREQRGEQSTKFLIETVKAAHHVIPFLNFQFDDRNVLMTYVCRQCQPSPLGMHAYESLDPYIVIYRTDLFLNHQQLHVPESPYFVGAHVCQYKDTISLWKILCNMNCAFSCLYKGTLSVMNADNISCMNKYCNSKESREFFKAVYNFQRDAILDWSPGANSITMYFNM
jgi:hypothetical protein